MRIDDIPKDKLLHFAGGTILYCVASALVGPAYGFLFAVIVAGAKEATDWIHETGEPDLLDFAATVLGALLPLLSRCIR